MSQNQGDLKSVIRDLIVTALFAVVAIGVSIGAGWIVFNKPTDTSRDVKEIAARTILDFAEEGTAENSKVLYSYKGEKLPETLSPDEVVEARTETSWTRRLPDIDGKAEYELHAFPQKVFYKQGSEWYYREFGRTDKKTFDAARKTNPVSSLFLPRIAYAANFFSGAGDGFVLDSSTVFSTANGDASGSGGADSTGASASATVGLMCVGKGCSNTYNINRAFIPFDTSTIPASAAILSASVNLYITSVVDQDNDGVDYITIVQTSQANSGTLAASDYSLCGAASSPTEGIANAQRKDETSDITASAYLSFTLNATGIGWIKKSGQTSNCGSTAGYTCLGVREGHDTTVTAPTTVNGSGNGISYSTSEASGTSQDPYLTVNYSTFAPWQFWDF